MARKPKRTQVRLEPLADGFGKRIDTAARLIGTRPEAAAAMNLSDDQLNRIIREASVPTFAAIAGLAVKSNCSFDWLAFGSYPQFRDSSLPPGLRQSPAAFAPADTVLVKRFDKPDGVVPFSMKYIVEGLRCEVEDVAIGEHEGDSMLPTIAAGDLLMVNLKRRRIADGFIFVMRLGEELVAKRVQRLPDGSLLLISDNKAYAPRMLTQNDADRVDVIGRLIWSGGPI